MLPTTMGSRDARISTQFRRAPTRYRPVARLAFGGMAEVWRADAVFEDGSAHPVAIKRVLPELGGGSASERAMFRAMFEDEARLGMILRHDNVVRVYDARDVGGTFIMVMELVDGDTLKGLLEPAWARGVGMPIPSALHVARELAAALAYIHTCRDDQGTHLGIVHRDVSPHNLLLGRDGGVKLTDFGLADAHGSSARSPDLIGGKLGYLAPEIVLQRRTDQRIDTFAAAICLWEMLAGRRLFQGRDDGETVRNVARCEVPSLRAIRDDVPDEVDRFVRACLAADPEARPHAEGMADALGALVRRHGDGVSARDVALLVGLHVARRDREKVEPSVVELGLAELLASELEDFVQQQRGGEAPLDPREFELGLTGGPRPRVRAPRGDFDD